MHYMLGPRGHSVGAVLDIETTGLNPSTEEIIELALILFRYDKRNGRIVGILRAYSGLREPKCSISRDSRRVHGISRSMVGGRRLNTRKIRKMLATSDFCISHNANFDRGFVERLLPALYGKTWLCSMRGIDWRGKGYSSRSLADLAAAHQIVNPASHRAEGDARTLLALLSYRRKYTRTRLYELLRNVGLIGGQKASSFQNIRMVL